LTPAVSVVIPARHAAHDLAVCLRAIRAQRLPTSSFEVLVVVDRDDEPTAEAAERYGARAVRQSGAGASSARGAGVGQALGEWVAFTDADCVPSATWLARLLGAAQRTPGCVGVAGSTIGLDSRTSAARFVDLSGGLDAETYLRHPKYPWAPTCNVMYRRSDLARIGGVDSLTSHDGADLHLRLRRQVPGPFVFEPTAVVLHRHRPTWGEYFRQQRWYGKGYAQFLLKWNAEFPWTGRDEARAWAGVLWQAMRPAIKDPSQRLLWRGRLVKQLAQRIGFLETYWRSAERQRWLASAPVENGAENKR